MKILLADDDQSLRRVLQFKLEKQGFKVTPVANGEEALDELARLGKEFAIELRDKNYLRCAEILNLNFKAQIQLAPASTTDYLSEMYKYARGNGALGGKLAGAGGGGAFIFYCDDPAHLTKALKEKFTDCFELNFEFHYENIKELNRI